MQLYLIFFFQNLKAVRKILRQVVCTLDTRDRIFYYYLRNGWFNSAFFVLRLVGHQIKLKQIDSFERQDNQVIILIMTSYDYFFLLLLSPTKSPLLSLLLLFHVKKGFSMFLLNHVCS